MSRQHQVIESKHNNTYKELLRIKQKGSATGYVLLEGERALRQLEADGLDFELFVRQGETIAGQVMNDHLFEKLCATKSPQGVLMKLTIPPEKAFDEGPVLVLDRISDPGNLGTLLRTASAFGIQNILSLVGSVDVYNDKVLRSSLGAVLSLNIRQRASLDDLAALYRPLFLADFGGEDFYGLSYPENFALVIGNEAHGVSPAIKELPSSVLTIPMVNAMESLNAAVAGAILMQHMMRD
ncbi:MAG TPA: RNA methyltransferase [Tissierellia bacterium]|nr:RNA methyltransferase [Tissierellia bacterium]